MLKTVLDHQKATVISEELPISFSGVSLLRRSGVCLCGISIPPLKILMTQIMIPTNMPPIIATTSTEM